MSALAIARWAEFEADFGPLTIQERLDAVIAHIAYTVHASAGGKEDPSKFKPQWRRQKPWTDDQIWKWLDAEAKREY
jgi:hypothetical protein